MHFIHHLKVIIIIGANKYKEQFVRGFRSIVIHLSPTNRYSIQKKIRQGQIKQYSHKYNCHS